MEACGEKCLAHRLLSAKYSDYADFKLCLSKCTLPVLLNLGFRYYIPGNLKNKNKNIDSQMWQSEYFVQVLRKQGRWRGLR